MTPLSNLLGVLACASMNPSSKFLNRKRESPYVHVSPKKAEEIVEKHLIGGKPVTAYGLEGMDIYDDNGELCRHFDDLPFYKKQKRLVLHNCGYINPEDIEEYIAVDGYQALAKVLTTMTPDDVINVISASNLRGRGGAGFPTGRNGNLPPSTKPTEIRHLQC